MRRPRTIGLALGVVGFLIGLGAAAPLPNYESRNQESYVRIANRFREGSFLHVERGPLESGPIHDGAWSADWVVERVADAPQFVKFRNRYRGGVYIHAETGGVEAGQIQPGWWSAQWEMVPVQGTDLVQIRNRFRPTTYLHVEQGPIACGPIEPGWWSAQWRVRGSGGQVAGQAQPVQPRPTSVAAGVAGGAAAGGAVATGAAGGTLPTASSGGNAGNQALSVANTVLFGESAPDICWRDTYGRGAGEVLSTCGADQEQNGLLCYPRCRAGFIGAGPMCHRQCPSGWTDIGVSCTKPGTYTRTPYAYGWPIESRSDGMKRCERSEGAGNCERDVELHYRKCREGYQSTGAGVCAPVCPAGFRNDGLFCARVDSYGRTAGEPMGCGGGLDQDGALCYPACRAGSTGVGPVCWANSCPANYPVNCGAACAISSSMCAMAILEQVQSTADVAINVAALVGTGGAATPALQAARMAGRQARRQLSNEARAQLRRQARKQLQDGLDYQKRKGGDKVQEAQGWLEKAENLEAASTLMVDAYEKGEFDFTQLTPSVADIEPTGVLAVVRSFNKPICR